MFFVATVGTDVVGWVHVAGSELEKLEHTAELTVGVIETYRGHGIGSHLLERGLAWAGSRGYEKMYNSVPSSNEEAVEFLKTNGWEIEAVREDHYKLGRRLRRRGDDGGPALRRWSAPRTAVPARRPSASTTPAARTATSVSRTHGA